MHSVCVASWYSKKALNQNSSREVRREAPDPNQGYLPQIWGGTEANYTVTFMDENKMRDEMARKGVRLFNDGRTNVHDEGRSERSSDGLDENVNDNIRENDGSQ
ncbi:hypothetical protein TNCV_4516331 [Trichonephila clavipes]|uniref:Uncharacterized protein n=1 Tax=Trichonephila clavipes TaxID=2585209 RepID=A0A8X6V6Q9_TRICX|nr:hypothetical protein TNCV_4516331 [Trichonephila clavipes]